ncbi:Cuticle Protein CPR RR-1 12 [Frankliniella occidentalis]|nr:Cuticle Protein CPR RR-1 12 [Frankliniella occidentalis]QBP34367.1 endocuticle structural glycoprotein CP-GN [Frankliniella occidentalis]
MKFLIIAALVAVAAARPQEYHDDIFHFSTKVNPQSFSRSSVVSQSVPVVSKTIVKSVPQYQQQYQTVSQYQSVPQYQQQVVVKSVPQYQQQVVVKSAPVYSQVHHVVEQQAAPVLLRHVEQEIPAYQSVQHVHQPVYQSVQHVAAHHVAAPVVSRTAFVPQYDSVSVSASAQPKYKILSQVQEFDPAGIYRVNFQTENGIQSAETGSVKDIQAKDGPVAAKEGSYSYTGPDGVVYTVNWIADEFGFRASGAHLPQVPEEIQRSLELNAAQPQKYDQDGNLVSQF